jgi:hypothetical protein
MTYRPWVINQVARDAKQCKTKGELADLIEFAEEECQQAYISGDLCRPMRRNKTLTLAEFRRIVKVVQNSKEPFEQMQTSLVNDLQALTNNILHVW